MKDWIGQIDEITAAFREAFGGLSEEQMNWKPTASTWSIAQNIHHLIVINESYTPVIESVRSGSYKLPFPGRFNFVVDFIGKTILNSVEPTRRRKMKTFPIWQPSLSEVREALEQFRKHQENLKMMIRESSDLVEKGTIISSPANRNIVYKLATAFDIIVMHERRHLEQAREVLTLLNQTQR